MKNIYKNTILGLLVVVSGMIPAISDATSFMPTGRTYYPAGNTQAINIVNNNYNNNVNTNNNQAAHTYRQAVQPVVIYAGTTTDRNRGVDVNSIAMNNLPTITVAPKPTVNRVATKSKCTTCSHTAYRLVKELNCGATVAINNTNVAKPTCSLVPALTASGAIELQWTTAGATVAFIDGGIGHVNTVSGKRIVTPNKDTAYNLTVLNDAGIAGTCGAKVNVSMANAGTVNVIANNTNYSYSLNGNTQSASVSNTTVVDNVKQDTTDTSVEKDLDNQGSDSGLFGSAFKKVVIPIAIVFLILIMLLILVMSKVKAAK